jgi:hypothetical protein
MRHSRAACGLALAALTSASASAVGAKGPACAKPEEAMAIQTAAIQQELMVAALTCREIERFNAFQRGFAGELRASDGRLERMFMRLYGARAGEAAYHAFKTKLANDASMRSIHDNPAYCQEAGTLFATALAPARPTLVTFVNGVQVLIAQKPIDACPMVEPVPGATGTHKRRR